MKLNRINIKTFVVIGIATLLTTGCAHNEKQRIILLEGINNDLTNRYNQLHGELDNANAANSTLQQQLLASQNEAGGLRSELAAQPDPIMLAAPGWTQTPTGAMIAIDSSVLFPAGKITLRKQALRALDSVVSTLQSEYASRDIIILGHTDDTPIKKSGWKDNWQLSSERSLAVLRYLSERGVDASRLISAGGGQQRPRATNDSNKNRATNRRVEIYAVDADLRLGRN